MAVVLTYPADPGQLGKNAAGVVAAFTATGYQNEGSGLTVTITDETLGGRILGVGPSSTDAEPSGTYAGWWAFSVYCPAFDSTGATIAQVESVGSWVSAAATLRVRSAMGLAAVPQDEASSTETAEGYGAGDAETVLAYADGSARLRVIVGDVFSIPAADAASVSVSTGGGGSSITSTFESGDDGWSFDTNLSRSSTSPIAGSWSVRAAGNGALTQLNTMRVTVASARSGITSIVLKYRATQTGDGFNPADYGGRIDIAGEIGGTNNSGQLVPDGTQRNLTLTPTGAASAGQVQLRVSVTDADDEGSLNCPYTVTIDDIVINGISS